jgi:hypothetical protein
LKVLRAFKDLRAALESKEMSDLQEQLEFKVMLGLQAQRGILDPLAQREQQD